MKCWISGTKQLRCSRLYFADGAGHAVCEDQVTADWVRSTIKDLKVAGRSFGAWSKDELSAYHCRCTVILDPAFGCLDVDDVLVNTLRLAGIAPEVKVFSVFATPAGGRAVRLFVSKSSAEAIKREGCELPTLGGKVRFRFAEANQAEPEV